MLLKIKVDLLDSYKTYSDEQLVELLKSSDDAAFNELYHRYWLKLFYVAGSKLEDGALAKEIVQDLFADLWERRYEIQLRALFKSYISVALKYKIINQQVLRKRARNYASHPDNAIGDVDHSTEQFLRFEELKDQLSKLVGELPEKCQLIFRLSRESGLSHKEIADKMEISEKTVAAQLYKALNRIRHRLSHLFSVLIAATLHF